MKTMNLDPANLEVFIKPPADLVKLVNSKKKSDVIFVKKSINPFIVSAIKKGKRIPLDSSKLQITLITRD